MGKTWPYFQKVPVFWGMPHFCQLLLFSLKGNFLYTLCSQERSILKCLKFVGHQGLEFFAMVGFYFARESIDFSTKGSEGVVITTIQDHFLSELPQPFNQVQVWRIRRQEQQFDIQTLGQVFY